MLPEDIDDFFRHKLDGHETPPADALWARLQAGAAETGPPPAEPPSERLDQLFRSRLQAHATPPRRELWERLEDEHLRPRQRRAAAWWPVALAAALALFVLAGGAGLWLGFPTGSRPGASVATRPGAPAGAQHPTAPMRNPHTLAEPLPSAGADAALTAGRLAPQLGAPPQAKNVPAVSKNMLAQATRPTAGASTHAKAGRPAAERAARPSSGGAQQPDAAASLPLVAQAAPRPAADEQQPAPPAPTAPVVAAVAPAVPSSGAELITVDVRRGDGAPRTARAVATALAAAPNDEAPRRLGGRLLQQAGHLLRGERVSLAEVTGLPENLTLRATVAGHSVSKSIQL